MTPGEDTAVAHGEALVSPEVERYERHAQSNDEEVERLASAQRREELIRRMGETAAELSGLDNALATPLAAGWLNEFHRVNIARQYEAFAPPHSLPGLVMCVAEEVGELSGAVSGVTGEKKRKAHLTNADILDAVADAITYLSLVADRAGCADLESLIAETFNMVSDRAGSLIKVRLPRDCAASPACQRCAELEHELREAEGALAVLERERAGKERHP